MLDLSRHEVASHVESELKHVLQREQPALYRHEFIPEFTPELGQYTHEFESTSRFGFPENNYWRYYENYTRIFKSMRQQFPSLVLQHCANGGTRDDLANLACFHETYTNEGEPPRTLQSYSGKTLGIPPEMIVIGFGAQPERGHLETYLRCAFTLSTPWLLVAVAPSAEQLTPKLRDSYRRYTKLYKEFIRPVMKDSKMYHHAPVSARNGVTDGNWFAVEFASADKSRAWATIVRLAESDEDHYLTNYNPIFNEVTPGSVGHSQSDIYHLFPRGIDPARNYRVTFDNSRSSITSTGYRLCQDGLRVRLDLRVHEGALRSTRGRAGAHPGVWRKSCARC